MNDCSDAGPTGADGVLTVRGPTATVSRFHRCDRGRPRFPRSVIDAMLQPSSDDEDRHYSQAVKYRRRAARKISGKEDFRGFPSQSRILVLFTIKLQSFSLLNFLLLIAVAR